MASLVDYVCGGGCERTLPIGQLYFCPSCPRLACQYCVTDEIDSYYCPNCLENLASAEASAFQNRCKKCFGCPVCFAALAPSSNAAGDLFYFSCSFCRWSSLDIGMKSDQLVKLISDSNTRERTSPAQQAVSALVDDLRREMKAAEKERRMREKFKVRPTLFGMTPTDPKGRPTLAAAEAERATRDQAVTYQGRRTAAQTQAQTQTETQTQSSEANVEDASTLAQRFALLATQPRATSALTPHRIPLMTRRSCRCKGRDKEGRACDKLLVKPEFSLTRAEFKRQLSALLLVPAVSFRLTAPLQAGTPIRLVIGLSNPLKAVAHLTLSTKDAALVLPTQRLSVGTLDIADLDDDYEKEKKEDKAEVVALRRANVLCVHASFTPPQPFGGNVALTVSGTSKPATGEMHFTFDVILHLSAATPRP